MKYDEFKKAVDRIIEDEDTILSDSLKNEINHESSS